MLGYLTLNGFWEIRDLRFWCYDNSRMIVDVILSMMIYFNYDYSSKIETVPEALRKEQE